MAILYGTISPGQVGGGDNLTPAVYGLVTEAEMEAPDAQHTVLKGLGGLEDVSLPGCTEISGYAFYKGSLKKIIADDVTVVKQYAFRDCVDLEEVSLKKAVTLETYALAYCPLKTVSLPKVETVQTHTFDTAGFTGVDEVTGDPTYSAKIELPEAVAFETYVFTNAKFDEISLPKFVDGSNSSNLFRGCKASKISLPECTIAPKDFFRDCNRLIDVTVTKVTTIKTNSFNGTSALLTLTLPAATSIESNAFSNSGVHDLFLPGSTMCTLVASISSVFANCPIYTDETARVHVNADLVDQYKAASYWSTIASKIVAIEE